MLSSRVRDNALNQHTVYASISTDMEEKQRVDHDDHVNTEFRQVRTMQMTTLPKHPAISCLID